MSIPEFSDYVFIIIIFLVFSCKPKAGNETADRQTDTLNSVAKPAVTPAAQPDNDTYKKISVINTNLDSLSILRPGSFSTLLSMYPEYNTGFHNQPLPDTVWYWFIRDSHRLKEIYTYFNDAEISAPTLVGTFKKKGYWLFYLTYYLNKEVYIHQFNIYTEKGDLLHVYKWKNKENYLYDNVQNLADVKIQNDVTFEIKVRYIYDKPYNKNDKDGLYFGFRIDTTRTYLKTLNEKGEFMDIHKPELKINNKIDNALLNHLVNARNIRADAPTKKALRLKRNEIFAIHGYIFKSPDLKEYFSKQPWYKPQYTNVDDKLSEIEKQNIATLINLEKEAKE